MDSVSEIKSRLPIEELVRQYCQLTKKGRNFVALCPFHHDTRPSFLISPDKGICYCFPCQKGGDIFTFYQQIEGVDFRQALKDLAEKTGVVLAEQPEESIKKDEKERLRDCLTAAMQFYTKQLQESEPTKEYLAKRGVTSEEISTFGLGMAPDSFSATYDHLLKAGFSRKEIQLAGLGVLKDMNDERMYDRFRNRLMFPIFDTQGRIAGFGGRTLGNDDAKYLNTSDSPLYHKSSVLFGFNLAHKAMRESKRCILVEGYFDVLACHRVGVHDVVATCGTALTEEHARLLMRSVDRVVLCLDQDRPGREAAERAFGIAAKEGLQVEGIVLSDKDPADAVLTSPDELKELLINGAKPFINVVLESVKETDITTPVARHAALERLMPLIHAVTSSTERTFMIRASAEALMTTETSFLDDLRLFEQKQISPKKEVTSSSPSMNLFSAIEITLGLFMLYPQNGVLLSELIAPEEGLAGKLYEAMKKNVDAKASCAIDTLILDEETRSKANILLLYCEEKDFHQWNESNSIREIRRNCMHANREHILQKQRDITKKLIEARKAGDTEQEKMLSSQYVEVLKLSKITMA